MTKKVLMGLMAFAVAGLSVSSAMADGRNYAPRPAPRYSPAPPSPGYPPPPPPPSGPAGIHSLSTRAVVF